MPFTSETAKLYRGPGGRKKGNPIQKAAAEIAREYIEANVKPVLETYLGLAAGQVVERTTAKGNKKFHLDVDPATTRHAVDKLMPDEQIAASTSFQVNFVQFNLNRDTPSLQAKNVSVPPLVSLPAQGQAGSVSVAPASWERQNGPE